MSLNAAASVMAKPLIFITGGTGYIGGTFLHLMLSRNYLNKFRISTLVRRSDDVKKMRELGVTPIIGSLDDVELIRRESSKAAIVFNTASCDHLPSAKAIIDGLTEHAQQTSTRPILIHTSGAGVLADDSTNSGVSPEDDSVTKIWDDADANSHAAIPSHAPHRHVDNEIFAASKAGLIKTYIIIPPTVFGHGLGPFAENRMSIQIPRLVYYSLKFSRVMYVGNGENQWSNVHVVDLAELYLLILEAAMKDEAPEGAKGIYYPSSEYFTWSAVAHRVAQVLYDKGLIKSPVATTGLQRNWLLGSNVRMTSTNAKRLGWTPKNGGTENMLKDVDWDVTLLLRSRVQD